MSRPRNPGITGGHIVVGEESLKKEKDLRQLLHNTIDVMSYEQCQKIAEFFNFSKEFDENMH